MFKLCKLHTTLAQKCKLSLTLAVKLVASTVTVKDFKNNISGLIYFLPEVNELCRVYFVELKDSDFNEET